MRVHGREDQMVREALWKFTQRKSGVGFTDFPITTFSERMSGYDQSMPVTALLNPDGSLYSPQNSDGSFIYIPGMDGPADPP